MAKKKDICKLFKKEKGARHCQNFIGYSNVLGYGEITESCKNRCIKNMNCTVFEKLTTKGLAFEKDSPYKENAIRKGEII